MFEPIAIIANSGLFPGAENEKRLFEAILKNEILLTNATEQQWRVADQWVLTTPDQLSKDHTWSKRGGYISYFNKLFHPEKVQFDQSLLQQLDPLYLWLILIWQRLEEQINHKTKEQLSRHPAIILGNLLYPSGSLAKIYEYLWLKENHIQPYFSLPSLLNRFHSGFPAQLLAQLMHSKPYAAYCLDAACASSLFAIKYACDYLQAGKVDIAVAGGISGCDDLFIHMGFSALNALSKIGQCKPLQQNTDGLVPSEGAGLIILKRLQDALRDKDAIYGVIRGAAVTNQGKGSGYLVPVEEGQTQAMNLAYQTSGIDPATISWIELHATGTSIGDKTELFSLAKIFKHSLGLGAIKGNIGHMITASGMGSLSMVLECFAKKVKHPTLFATEDPLPLLEKTPFRLLTQPEPWELHQGIRRAGINAFGFGGNNAHLIVEEFTDQHAVTTSYSKPASQPQIAVVAMDAAFGSFSTLESIVDAFYFTKENTKDSLAIEKIELDLSDFHIPPNDLKKSLGQQLIILKLVNGLLKKIKIPPHFQVSVLMGMQCSTEICRHGLRWRLPANFSSTPDKVKEWLQLAAEQLGMPLTAADALGCMPNILVNQINRHYDLKGPSCSIASEQVSGIDALEIALQQLKSKEIDMAIVGAVDMCAELVQREAIHQVLNSHPTSDAATVMILMRKEDSQKLGLPQIVTLQTTPSTDQDSSAYPFLNRMVEKFGYSHATYALMQVLIGMICCAYKLLPGSYQPYPKPWLSKTPHTLTFNPSSFVSFNRSIKMEGTTQPFILSSSILKKPSIYFFSASSKDELLQHLHQLTPLPGGTCRLTIVANDKRELAEKIKQAIHLLNQYSSPYIEQPGLYYAEKPYPGKTAFIFPEGSMAYVRMGYELALAYPTLIKLLADKIPNLQIILDNLYDYQGSFELSPSAAKEATAYLNQLHALFFESELHYQADVNLKNYTKETIEDAYHHNIKTFIIFGPNHHIESEVRETLKNQLNWIISCDDSSNSSLQQLYFVRAQLIAGSVINDVGALQSETQY